MAQRIVQVKELTKKQKEAQIAYHKNRIEQILQGLRDPASVVHEMYFKHSPKKDMIMEWASHLEELSKLGEYKESVDSIASYITNSMKKMGFERSLSYVWEVLPFKYKQADYNRSQKNEENSSTQQSCNSSASFEKENAEYIDLIDHTITFLKDIVRPKLSTHHFVSLLDHDELEEFILVHYNTLKMGKDIFNDKKKDMTQTQCLLVEAIMHATSTHAAELYMEKIKDLFKFSGKQAMKILKGYASDLHPLYDPKTKAEAMKRGCYGMRCADCGSWRVWHIYDGKNSKEFKCHCFACGIWFDAVTEVIKLKKTQK